MNRQIAIQLRFYILFFFYLDVFPSLSPSRDVDGRMLLDIFDEKLHPLSVRPQLQTKLPLGAKRSDVSIHQQNKQQMNTNEYNMGGGNLRNPA